VRGGRVGGSQILKLDKSSEDGQVRREGVKGGRRV
jgi:hypothetical protein